MCTTIKDPSFGACDSGDGGRDTITDGGLCAGNGVQDGADKSDVDVVSGEGVGDDEMRVENCEEEANDAVQEGPENPKKGMELEDEREEVLERAKSMEETKCDAADSLKAILKEGVRVQMALKQGMEDSVGTWFGGTIGPTSSDGGRTFIASMMVSSCVTCTLNSMVCLLWASSKSLLMMCLVD